MAALLTRAEPVTNGSSPRERRIGPDPTSPSSAPPKATPRRRNSARIVVGVIVLVLASSAPCAVLLGNGAIRN